MIKFNKIKHSAGKKWKNWSQLAIDGLSYKGDSHKNTSSHSLLLQKLHQKENLDPSRVPVTNSSSSPKRKSKTIQSWKPITLKAPLLLSMSTICIAILVILEVLSQLSSRNKGIMFAESVSDFSTGQTFVYAYLPTIISVLISMTWNWIDLDIKRLEGFFQLSKPGGAEASRSILLQYPIDFLATVPIRALQRRHWTVFLGGIGTVLIFWGVTPSQSAIFNTGKVTLVESTPGTLSSGLTAATVPGTISSVQFLYSAYAYIWLDQALPTFTTTDYALAPFSVRAFEKTPNDKIWIATTTLYETELFCTPAETIGGLYNRVFTNGQGCNVSLNDLPQSPTTVALYFNYYVNSEDGVYDLQYEGCPTNASHTFLAYWNLGLSNGVNTTAVFCEPSYFSQRVMASVHYPNLSIQSIDRIGQREQIDDSIFNRTHFEYLISAGASDIPVKDDLPVTQAIDQQTRIDSAGYDTVTPISYLIGSAIGLTFYPQHEYRNHTVLSDALTAAHKLHFSLAANYQMSLGKQNITTSVKRNFEAEAVMVVRIFAIVVEVLLGVVAVLALLILFFSYGRSSGLESDPASLAALMNLVPSDEHDRSIFATHDGSSEKELERNLKGKWFEISLKQLDPSQSNRLKLKPGPNRPTSSSTNQSSTESSRNTKNQDKAKPIRPAEASLPIGLIFILTLAGSAVVLVFLKIQADRYNGLSPPSANTVVQQLLLNYLPTAIATIIEPIWTLLNRMLAIMLPLEQLRKGHSPFGISISADYGSLPPQLVAGRAFRAKHFLLGSVCLMILLANILAVAMSNLFKKGTIIQPTAVQMAQGLSSMVQIGDLSEVPTLGSLTTSRDYFYVADLYLSRGTPLPPWISPSYFFRPFSPTNASSSSQTFTASTIGFGVDLACQAINDSIHFEFNFTDQLGKFTGDFPDKCSPAIDYPFYFKGATNTTRNTSVSMELIRTLDYYGDIQVKKRRSACKEKVVAAWVHGRLDEEGNFINKQKRALLCQPSLKTAKFNVSVDYEGRISNYTRIGDFNTNTSTFLADTDDAHLLLSGISGFFAPFYTNAEHWHSNISTYDWANTLLKLKLNDSSLVDPEATFPAIESIVPAFQDVYRLVFSVMLGLGKAYIFNATNTNSTTNTTTVSNIIIGSTTTSTTRVYLSSTNFLLALIILCLYIVVAVFYYIFRPAKFLPRMPTSVASQMCYFAESSAVLEDVREAQGILEKKDRKEFWEDRKYGYGKFIGGDGKAHVGIERWPFYIPVGRNGEIEGSGV